jgi:hypothetical protein
VAGYLTSEPVITCWGSPAPSKIVKTVVHSADCAGQRPEKAVVSARIQHGHPEDDGGLRPARCTSPEPFEHLYAKYGSLNLMAGQPWLILELQRWNVGGLP